MFRCETLANLIVRVVMGQRVLNRTILPAERLELPINFTQDTENLINVIQIAVTQFSLRHPIIIINL